jgi:hypothetical protein
MIGCLTAMLCANGGEVGWRRGLLCSGRNLRCHGRVLREQRTLKFVDLARVEINDFQP